MNVAELAKLIARLPKMAPVARARMARDLVDDAKRLLSATADAAVEEATRSAKYAEVARELGVSEASVNKAVSRHRRQAASGA
jgi:transposase-like protein